jgi:hypothetical protein
MKAFALGTIILLMAIGCSRTVLTSHRDRPIATAEHVVGDLRSLAAEHHVGFTNVLTRRNLIECAFTEAAGLYPEEGVSVKDHIGAAALHVLRQAGWQATLVSIEGGLGRSATCRIVATMENESPSVPPGVCVAPEQK